MHTVIPCGDCDRKRGQLVDLGFRVLGCTEIPGRPKFCSIEFVEDATPAAAPLAPAAAPSPTPAAAPLAPAMRTATGLTPTQVATAQAIVNLFETGEVLGDYGSVTLIHGDSGHLTFGRSQTTLGSGNLATLIQQYCAIPDAVFGQWLAPFLPRFLAIDLTLDDDGKLHNVLRATADDRAMRETQDRFFDVTYWQRAQKAAVQLGILSPLGTAVVYDSHVHGSWGLIRSRTSKQLGDPAVAGERRWIAAYVAMRRRWLAAHRSLVLRKTVYRMDAFQSLVDNGQWALDIPLVVRGREISDATLSATPPGCYDGPQPGTRTIARATPLLRGLDVRRVQLALSDRNVDIRADGVFGPASERHVRAFQAAEGLPTSGALDPAFIISLVG